MLDYRLTVFRTVAEQLNFTRAARELHISQPAVTLHVKALEDYYQTKLFHRSPQGITLTEAGHALLEHARRIAELHHAVGQRIRSRSQVVAGTFRAGASTTISQYVLPRWLAAFRAKFPAVELRLSQGNTEEIIGALQAGRIELALIEGPTGRPDCKTEKFLDDEIVCVVSPRHPLAARTRVSPADLRGQDFVLREQGSGTRLVVEQALKRAGLDAKKWSLAFELASSEAIKGVLKQNFGVGFLSKWAVRDELKAGTLRQVAVSGLEIRRPFYFLYPQGPRPAGVAGAFLDFIKQAARQMD